MDGKRRRVIVTCRCSWRNAGVGCGRTLDWSLCSDNDFEKAKYDFNHRRNSTVEMLREEHEEQRVRHTVGRVFRGRGLRVR